MFQLLFKNLHFNLVIIKKVFVLWGFLSSAYLLEFLTSKLESEKYNINSVYISFKTENKCFFAIEESSLFIQLYCFIQIKIHTKHFSSSNIFIAIKRLNYHMATSHQIPWQVYDSNHDKNLCQWPQE